MHPRSVIHVTIKLPHLGKQHSIGSVYTCRVAFLFVMLYKILPKTKAREEPLLLFRHACENFWTGLNLRVSLIQWFWTLAAHLSHLGTLEKSWQRDPTQRFCWNWSGVQTGLRWILPNMCHFGPLSQSNPYFCREVISSGKQLFTLCITAEVEGKDCCSIKPHTSLFPKW